MSIYVYVYVYLYVNVNVNVLLSFTYFSTPPTTTPYPPLAAPLPLPLSLPATVTTYNLIPTNQVLLDNEDCVVIEEGKQMCVQAVFSVMDTLEKWQVRALRDLAPLRSQPAPASDRQIKEGVKGGNNNNNNNNNNSALQLHAKDDGRTLAAAQREKEEEKEKVHFKPQIPLTSLFSMSLIH